MFTVQVFPAPLNKQSPSLLKDVGVLVNSDVNFEHRSHDSLVTSSDTAEVKEW